MTPQKRRPLWLLAAGLWLLAAGCSRDQATPPAIKPEPTPVPGGTLKMRIPPPVTLDPAFADFEHESCVINQIFDGLVELDREHIPKPALASYWTLDDDLTTYTFYLRKDAKFHDGHPVTAHDFVYTFERVLGRGSILSTARDLLLQLEGAPEFAAGDAEYVTGLNAVGDYRLVLKLSRPVANYPTLLANDGLGLVSRHALELSDDGEETFGTRPVGTGPFRFKSWDDNRIILERNEHYFGKPAYLDRVELHLSESPLDMSTLEALKDGSLDFVPCDPTLAPRYVDVADLHNWDNSLMYLACNVSRDPVDNALIRQAIAHAIDRSRLVDADFSGLEASTSLIPRGLFGHSLKASAPEYNPDKARALLAEAGYPDGDGLYPVHLWSLAHSKLEDLIREDLKAIGIPCQLKIVHFTVYERAIKQSKASLFMLPFAFSLADGTHMLRRLFHSEGGYNLFSYSSEFVDELFDTGQSLQDSNQRFGQSELAQRELLRDLPVIPLLLTRNTYAARKHVLGLTPGPFGLSSIKLEYAWLAPPRE